MRPLLVVLVLIVATSVTSSRAEGPAAVENRVIGSITGESVMETVRRLAGFGTRHTLSATDDPERGVGAARAWIELRFESFPGPGGGPCPLRVSLEAFDAPPSKRMPEGGRVVNVVAVLPGRAPADRERRCYVVAHYDSRNGEALDAAGGAPGANDDASGVAVVLECARAMAAEGPFDATIVFLCTAGEEQGLLGAKFHAESAAARGERIVAVLNNDIVGDPTAPAAVTDSGGATPDAAHVVRVFSEGVPRVPPATVDDLAKVRESAAESDSPSRQLARYVAETGRWLASPEAGGRAVTPAQVHPSGGIDAGPVLPMLVFRPDRFLRGGDHLAFNEAGFAAVRFTEADEEYSRQHQNVREEMGPDGLPTRTGDVPEHVDGRYVAGVARLNAATLARLASAPPAPGRTRIVAKDLVNSTTIRWDASPWGDEGGVRYEVVWRLTTEPDWTHGKAVGAVLEFTLPTNKDDYFYGVRAVSRQDRMSPVSFAGAANE